MSKKILILFAIIASFSFIFIGRNENILSNKTENNKFNDFEISTTEQCRAEGGIRAICAAVKNNSNTDYKFVQIQINLFNEKGNLIGNTTASVNNLDKKQKWEFTAVVPDGNATVFQVKDIIGVN